MENQLGRHPSAFVTRNEESSSRDYSRAEKEVRLALKGSKVRRSARRSAPQRRVFHSKRSGTRERSSAKKASYSLSGDPLRHSNITAFLANQKPDSDCVSVLKVVQRFRKHPHEWPIEEQPFGIMERDFVGKMMHPIELRPERGFVNVVPFGLMMLRHFFRKIRAKLNYELYKSTGIFDEDGIRAGTIRVFEIISQHAQKNRMAELVARNFCSNEAVRRFDTASSNMSSRQRELLNLTEQDVFALAPGVLGPFQLIHPLLRGKQPFITYSLLCCAFYKKQMLFDAVRDLPLADNIEKAEHIEMPVDYGYAAPRLVFSFITFGNKILGKYEVDDDVEVLEFQYLVI
ncbi:hypothetical protein KIN20_027067 [Parelaphostrongylus tenuis]|uniref:Uncharacterized protein n=1 Tax=Parelaphostrongylus tenuis TaxID=148309 RepID=A0AAD5WDN8_PARTN|nr:hypothetical protein KIN20_027067 [Parelaphostrongylus tenuis]